MVSIKGLRYQPSESSKRCCVFLRNLLQRLMSSMLQIWCGKGDFAYFFELQAMYEASLKSNEAHQEFIKLRREQNQEYRALKKTKKQEEDVLAKLAATNPALEGIHPNPKSIKEFQKNAKLLQRSINEQYSSKHELRREIGRLEAWQRVSKETERRESPRSTKRSSTTIRRPRAPEVNINEVRQKASSGESISSASLMLCCQKAALQASAQAKDKSNSKNTTVQEAFIPKDRHPPRTNPWTKRIQEVNH